MEDKGRIYRLVWTWYLWRKRQWLLGFNGKGAPVWGNLKAYAAIYTVRDYLSLPKTMVVYFEVHEDED